MGDRRFDRQLDRLLRADDRVAEIHAMGDDEVIQALAAASVHEYPYVADILATEALNRMRRSRVLADEVRAAEQRYRALFHSVSEPLIAGDLDRRIADCNPAFERLLGYTAAELRGQDVRMLYPDEPDQEEAERLIREGLETRQVRIARGKLRAKAGHQVEVELRAFALTDPDGQLTGFAALVRDVGPEARADT